MEATIERKTAEKTMAGDYLRKYRWNWNDMEAFDRAAILAYIGAEKEDDPIDLNEWDDPEKIDEVRSFRSYWTLYKSYEDDLCSRMVACKSELELGKALAFEEGYEEAAEEFPFMTIDYIGLARDYLAKHPHKYMKYVKDSKSYWGYSSFSGYVFSDDFE